MARRSQSTKPRSSQGQLTFPLATRIWARQRLLKAIQQHSPQVLRDLRNKVYPTYKSNQGSNYSACLDVWAEDFNLLDEKEDVYDWVGSCAEHTLYAWALEERLEWREVLPGRPPLAIGLDTWALYKGTAAFETWVSETEAAELYPGVTLPHRTKYDWLVVTADGSLTYLDENGYNRIENTNPIKLIHQEFSLGPYSYDPIAESAEMAFERLLVVVKKELRQRLKSVVRDVDAVLGTTVAPVQRDEEPFMWFALGLVNGWGPKEIESACGHEPRTRQDAIAKGLERLRHDFGLPTTVLHQR